MGRRRSPNVGRIVGQGRIRFMADGRNDRDLSAIDGFDNVRAVEAPQVFHGSAAAADDEDVQVFSLPHLIDGSGDGLIDALPLDGDGPKNDIGIGIALAGNAADVVQDGARRRRQDADTPGKARQFFFMAAVEVALGLKVLLDLFILGLEGSRPLGKELFNDKGKGAALS